VEALAATLDGVLRLDTGARETLAERAIANVRANFTKEQMCAKTLEVYSEVLTEAAARAYGRS
jgi:glycosyltransferase involved in cell wall biosynthesis